jgi:hypothetical protein
MSSSSRHSPATFETLLQEIQKDRKTEILKHKLAIKARKNLSANTPQPLNIFADGDSWFDYPLSKDVVDWIKHDAIKGTLVLNMAHYGDASYDTLGVTKRQNLITALSDPSHGKFDVILVSMGGNDVAGDQFCLWVDDKVAGVDPIYALSWVYSDVLEVVEGAYEDLIKIRDKLEPNAIMFLYAYDFAVPNGQGVCGVGPWLKPSLDYRGWTDYNEATTIVKTALGELNTIMSKLESKYSNVVYIKTQGTLDPTTDWANELHPTESGFHKIANLFMSELKLRFPGRI